MELLIISRQEIEVIVAKPELALYFTEAFFVLRPVLVKINGSVFPLLIHQPSAIIGFLVAVDIQFSCSVRNVYQIDSALRISIMQIIKT